MEIRLLMRAARLGMRTASRAATVRERLRSGLSTERIFKVADSSGYDTSGRLKPNATRSRFTYASSKPFNVPLSDTSPAVFTVAKDGTGQGAIQVYPQYSLNRPDNPAPKGFPIVMFATGFGVWNPPVPEGAITLWGARFTAQPVSVTIGGLPAQLYYVGISPYQLWGTLQVTAYVLTNVGSGQQPVVLKVGDNDNAQQKVTMAVQ